jgi:acyl-CoA reductase-like NAD-dependent aldehyde dehydrogenase
MAIATRIPEAARGFLDGKEKALWIDNAYVDATSGTTITAYNPADGSDLGVVQEASVADVDRAVRSARAAFDGAWSAITPADRAVLLWRIADVVDANTEELALLETLNNGKPLTAARRDDVPNVSAMFRYFAGWATKIQGKTIDISGGNYLAYTRHEPLGVVAAIIPWNYPLAMAGQKLAPALACGCTMIVKPAEQTPLSMLRLAELLAEAGLPAGVVNVLNGMGETTGQALVDHPDVDKVAFTGSADVGRQIVRSSAGNLKRVSLELGGKSPNVFFDDAPDDRVGGAVSGIFYNMGQDCSAGSRLFLQHGVYDEILSGVVEGARALRVGPGLDEATEIGPLVSREQTDRVLGYLTLGATEGQVPVGGGRASIAGYEGGNFVQPSVITDTTNDARVAQEEIFGPVVVAMPFKDEDDLVRKANDTVYGLGAAVWSANAKRAHRVAHRIRAGTVWINCYDAGDVSIPFGGFKQSGHGREKGEYALELYTEVKAVVANLED